MKILMLESSGTVAMSKGSVYPQQAYELGGSLH